MLLKYKDSIQYRKKNSCKSSVVVLFNFYIWKKITLFIFTIAEISSLFIVPDISSSFLSFKVCVKDLSIAIYLWREVVSPFPCGCSLDGLLHTFLQTLFIVRLCEISHKQGERLAHFSTPHGAGLH